MILKKYFLIYALVFLSFNSFGKIHYRIVNDTMNFKQMFSLDVNQDGINDYQFNSDSSGLNLNYCTVTGLNGNQILDNSKHNYPDALNAGDQITGYWSPSGAIGTFSGAGQFDGKGPKYLGIQLTISTGITYYGWIQLLLNANCTKLIIIDLAYSDSSFGPVNAGQKFTTGILQNEVLNYFDVIQDGKKFTLQNAQNDFYDFKVSVYSLNGKLLLSQEISQNYFYLELPQNIYMLKFESVKGIKTKKIFISN